MLPTISTGNVASALAGEYEVANSLRFSVSDDSLSKTYSSSGNTKTWTLSTWIKRSNLDTSQNQKIFGTNYASLSEFMVIFNNSGTDEDKINILNYTGGGGAIQANATTARVFRDPSAWFNLIIALDTTQSSESDRLKVYINGSLATLSGTIPSQNADLRWNNSSHTLYIGEGGSQAVSNFQGYQCETVFVDGTALDQNSFGEFDSDSPTIWKPKDVSGLSLGSNGFYLDYEDSSNLGNDVSGSNNWTVNQLTATDQSTDTCTNNFSVLNNLIQSSATYSDGNLTVAISSNKSLMSTIGVSSGKFYFETKINTKGSTYLGFCSERNTGANFSSYRPLTESALVNTTGNVYDAGGNTGIDSLPSIADDDIIGCALDVDNKKFWWSKNGQWYSANASSDSTINISDVEAGNNGYDFSSWTGQFVFASFGASTNANNISVNFGSPSYSVSSPNSDANGYGAFSYTVPTNFYAINSKNLAEFG
tara:strand:+ start:1751 stop:3187 length:1437 start_codon:yes stop_codon:yes gene_type:complete